MPRTWCSNCERIGLPALTDHAWTECPHVVCSLCNQHGHIKSGCPQNQKAGRGRGAAACGSGRGVATGGGGGGNVSRAQVLPSPTVHSHTPLVRAKTPEEVLRGQPQTVTKTLFCTKSPSRDMVNTPLPGKRPCLTLEPWDPHALHPKHPSAKEALGSVTPPSPMPRAPEFPLRLHKCSNCGLPSGAYTKKLPETKDAAVQVQTSLW